MRPMPSFLRLLVCVLATGAARGGELGVAVRDRTGLAVQYAVVLLDPAVSEAPRRAPPVSAVVDQKDKQFHPWVLAVSVGAAVSFANHDDITHHVYSFSPAKRFSYRLQTGEVQGPLAFDAPGVVVLGCNIHDWMVGYLFVTDAPRFLVSDATGHARFTELGAGEWRVRVWHPGLAEDAARYDQQVTIVGDGAARVEVRFATSLRETGPRHPLESGSYHGP